MNWRVARLCAWETYFDTPYYEQLQYVGDTRIQALISLYMTGDDRLVRQAITHFDVSRIPEGITASRYPSDLGQYIPTFSLIWVAMVHDYWMHRDDPAYVRDLLPGVRGVSAGTRGIWTRNRPPRPHAVVELRGLGEGVAAWASRPARRTGTRPLITLQFAYALQRAARAGGRARPAHRRRPLPRPSPDGLARPCARRPGTRRAASSSTRRKAQLVEPADQHDGGAGGRGARRRAARAHGARARRQDARAGDLLLRLLRARGAAQGRASPTATSTQLAPWQEMLALGLTTTAESPEPTRSDSHAWSAHPNYGLLATVLGVRPAEPGFRSVRIEPHLGPLARAEGRIPHPRGDIEVRLTRSGEAGVRGEVVLPPGLSGSFEWAGRRLALRPGRQEVTLEPAAPRD